MTFKMWQVTLVNIVQFVTKLYQTYWTSCLKPLPEKTHFCVTVIVIWDVALETTFSCDNYPQSPLDVRVKIMNTVTKIN